MGQIPRSIERISSNEHKSFYLLTSGGPINIKVPRAYYDIKTALHRIGSIHDVYSNAARGGTSHGHSQHAA